MRRLLLATVALTLLSGCHDGAPSVAPIILKTIEPSRFLAQWRCPDGTLEAAHETPCAGSAPLWSRDAITQRRHDWPGSNGGPEGYQVRESYALPDGRWVTIWSYPPFGPFASANGDGGEVYTLLGDTVSIEETQDGGLPGVLQTFCGPDGWVAFKTSPPTGSWAETIAQLKDVPAGAACGAPDLAFTRWRLETVTIPFLVDGRRADRELQTIISEHYDAKTIATAHHLERFFFAEGSGLVIWESWTDGASAGADLALRGPGTAWSVAPAAGWSLSDVRTATNVMTTTAPWKGDDYGWPPEEGIQ